MFKSHLYEKQEIEILESLVHFNERLVASCNISIDTSIKKVAVLTNISLRIVDILKSFNWNFTRNFKLFKVQNIPLIDISDLSITNIPNTTVEITFLRNGCRCRYSFVNYLEGENLANTLNNALFSLSNGEDRIADQLEKIAQLYNIGVLSQSEYEKVKQRFLAGGLNKVEQASQFLQNLHSLQISGALTSSEFQIKKWDILSKNQIE